MSAAVALKQRYYAAQKYDGTLAFYSMVRAATRPTSAVLNLGAGPATDDRLKSLKGEVASVTGLDIDPAVLDNTELDDAKVYDGSVMPFSDFTFDVVYADYVLEHVENPTMFLFEISRVLKRGGCFLFRTPNLWHYVAMASRLTPHFVHRKFANEARCLPDVAHEPWPTFYRCNTRSKVKKLARSAGFNIAELRMVECEPSYLMFHPIPFMAGVAYERAVNSTEYLSGIRSNIFCHLTINK